MRLSTIVLGFILGLFSISTMAGGGHDHGHSHSQTQINKDTAGKKAQTIVTGLVKRQKIDKTWKGIAANSIEKKGVGNIQEWLVIFKNKNITDKSKQKLYVFLTLGGDYIAANFTGK